MPDSEPVVFRPSRERDARRATRRRALWRTVLAAVVLGFLALWGWGRFAERRALLRLPAPERQAMYLRLYEELDTVCKDAAEGPLQGHCRSDALFLRQFPECDDGCRTLTSRYVRHPVR